MTFETIIEPFRIKVVEQIKMTTPEEREEMIRAAEVCGQCLAARESPKNVQPRSTRLGQGRWSDWPPWSSPSQPWA